ncbi:hypothetical protein MTE1_5320 [Klebsiella pneumoniae JHCK1]|nr:hypothetical protein MTE1_5320 [Klebsiella pneumoniae JHCK1]
MSNSKLKDSYHANEDDIPSYSGRIDLKNNFLYIHPEISLLSERIFSGSSLATSTEGWPKFIIIGNT